VGQGRGRPRQATAELERFRATSPRADSYYALGEIRRLRGDIEGRGGYAGPRSRPGAPARAGAIRLAQGKVKAAQAAIDAAVVDEAPGRWARARLLPRGSRS
jgi:hypothetical protein